MKKRVLSIMLCMGMTMTLFAGCGSAEQKKADNTEAVQETSTLSLMDKDSTEEATEAAEVTETTEAAETADLAASADTSSEAAAETSASGNDAAASGSTAKADAKKETKSGSKSDSNSGSASQASQPAASGSGSAKADNTAAPAQPQQTTSAQPASQPQPAAHEHQWEQYVKDTIYHPETGHYETKVVQAAYDEPQYDWHYICNKCGKDLGTDETTDLIDHEDVCDGSYRSDLVQVGTIHHDAVTEQVWVVDQAAWTEQVYGYRCSCGATK